MLQGVVIDLEILTDFSPYVHYLVEFSTKTASHGEHMLKLHMGTPELATFYTDIFNLYAARIKLANTTTASMKSRLVALFYKAMQNTIALQIPGHLTTTLQIALYKTS